MVKSKKRTQAPDLEMMEDPWRIFRIMAEFVDGFEEMKNVGKAVSIFGSARIKAGHPYYEQAEKTGFLLVKAGYAVITGGGQGIGLTVAERMLLSGGKVSIWDRDERCGRRSRAGSTGWRRQGFR